MENQIVSYMTSQGKIELSPEIIKKYLVSGDPSAVSDEEVTTFLALCRYQHLNPFLKEAYLIKFKGSPAQLIVSQDVFIQRAAANPNCGGWEDGIIVLSPDKKELSRRKGTMLIPGETLMGGWCKVIRNDWQVPLEVEVTMAEYDKGMANWKKMPATMICKVARSQALRRAFQAELQGLYDEAEGASILNVMEGEFTVKEPVQAPKSKSQAAAQPQATSGNKKLSEAQVKRFYAIVGSSGASPDIVGIVQDYIVPNHRLDDGKFDWNNTTKEEYDELCALFESDRWQSMYQELMANES